MVIKDVLLFRGQTEEGCEGGEDKGDSCPGLESRYC